MLLATTSVRETPMKACTDNRVRASKLKFYGSQIGHVSFRRIELTGCKSVLR